MKPLLEMKGVTKCFPGVIANDHVNLTVYPGEVHALLGENGAGKSTLMNILSGIYAPNEGVIELNGKPVKIESPKAAISHGIGMVHQHFKLIEPMTVAENIFLAVGKRCPYLLNKKKMEDEIRECSREFGLEVDPGAIISQLSVGEQQRVEIVKQLYCGADILILDEPTAVLAPQETEKLFAVLHSMTEKGKAIVFITHKLYEVMTYSDRITVLRGGKSVATMLTRETTQSELVDCMVGGHFVEVKAWHTPVEDSHVVLKLSNVEALDDKKVTKLRGIDLEIRSGEILGIAGVSGNGQKELAEVITGLRPSTAGTLTLNGEDITNKSVSDIRHRGIAYIPEDRMEVGLVGAMNMKENVILRRYDDPKVISHGMINEKAIENETEEMVKQFSIKNAGLFRPVSLMSGGNLQKLLLAREVQGDPDLIVAAYPVHGVDVGATDEIHRELFLQRDKGAAVLLISEDLEELKKMSDRVAVLYDGRIMDIIPIKDFSYDGIGLLMTGGSAQ